MKDWKNKNTFLDDSNLETIGPGIYVYKKFISQEEIEKITDVLNKRAIDNPRSQDNILEIIRDVKELFPIWEKMSQFLYPTHVIHPRLEATIIKPGDGGMYPHTDSPGEGGDDTLTQYDVWSTCTSLDYGVITYFGEYTDGQVFYPELGIEIFPEPGDLIIHNALLLHGVKEVTSGVRYAFSNFCLPATKNPGSFYNFNSEEYLNIRSKENFLDIFEIPLKLNERDYVAIIEPEYDPITKTWKYEEKNTK